MKPKLILLLIAISTNCTAFAQDFTFSYDASGNRIERIIYLSAKTTFQNNGGTNQPGEEEIAAEETMKDQLSGFDIKLYPNPTKGEVLVKISGEEEIETASYHVYDANGRQVAGAQFTSSNLQINLSRQKAGTYSLVLNINGKQQTWKIIKE